jgi:hypothetical protein
MHSLKILNTKNMNNNNAAHRLCHIIEKAVDSEGEQKDTCIAIGEAMGISDFSNRSFMIDFFVLISEVHRSILNLKNVPRKPDYINTIQEIQQLFFTHNLAGDHWPNIRHQIKNRNLTLILDACANFIATENPLPDLNETELNDYLDKCEQILKEVTGSDLEDPLKTFLIVRLEEICSAIRNYPIGGSERLKILVEANIGGMILRSAGISGVDREKPILQKLFRMLLTFGSLLGMVTDSQTLLQSGWVTQFLLPPGK